MEEGDALIAVHETDGTENIVIATHDGQAVCFRETDVRAMGRDAMACGASACAKAISWWAPAWPRKEKKFSPLRKRDMASGRRWRNTALPTGAVWAFGTMPSRTRPALWWASRLWDGSEDLLLVTQSGILIRTAVENIRAAGRATQGVIVMRFKEEGDQVIALALAEREEEKEGAEESAQEMQSPAAEESGQEDKQE